MTTLHRRTASRHYKINCRAPNTLDMTTEATLKQSHKAANCNTIQNIGHNFCNEVWQTVNSKW